MDIFNPINESSNFSIAHYCWQLEYANLYFILFSYEIDVIVTGGNVMRSDVIDPFYL